MKITVSKSELQSKLKLVGKIIQPNKINHLYEYFLFEVDELLDDAIYVSGSDDSGRITSGISCKISGTPVSRFAIEAKKLLSAISEISEQPLIFTFTARNDESVDVVCRYATGKFELVGLKGDEYPEFAEMPADSPVMQLNSLDFLTGLKNTHYCCANDELRPVMNGVYFDRNESGTTYVASDGHKLAMKELFSQAGERLSFILPSRIARILTGIIPAESQSLEITASSSSAIIECPEFTLRFRLIDGRFPNYRSVIPQGNNKKAQVNRGDLISAIKRVVVFSSNATSLIELNFTANSISVSAQDLDYSTSADEAVQAQYSGAEMAIGFNGSCLIDLLNNIQSDEVVIYLSDPSRAGLIKGTETTSKESDLTTLLMPLMINQ